MSAQRNERLAYEAVVFDLFGTLVQERTAQVNEDIAARVGLPVDSFVRLWTEGYRKRMTGSCTVEEGFLRACDVLGAPNPESALRQFMEARLRYLRDTLTCFQPGAVIALTSLVAGGVPLVLLSNATLDVPALWASSALASYFTASVFSCEIGTMKPDPKAYHAACSAIAVEPRSCLFVGDGNDGELGGAAASGLTPVQMLSGRASYPEARCQITSLDQILPIVGLVDAPIRS